MSKAYIMMGGKRYNLTEAGEERTNDGQGDPRFSEIPHGVTGGGGEHSAEDLRQCMTGIYETLKTILSRLDTNMPWLTRETHKDGGK